MVSDTVSHVCCRSFKIFLEDGYFSLTVALVDLFLALRVDIYTYIYTPTSSRFSDFK